MSSIPDLNPASADNWLEHAAARPIAFAQVREDAWIDEWVVRSLPAGCKILMVASGGCTAAALAASGSAALIHLVDPNPSQIALARLKLRLLSSANPENRLAVLGHLGMPQHARREQLSAELRVLNVSPDSFGPLDQISSEGLDYSGRYELLFSKLRSTFAEATNELGQVARLSNPADQAHHVAPETKLGHALDTAFDSVMSLPNLVRLFGEGATRNRVEPFSRHFARRTRQVLSNLPASNNPYFWTMMLGRLPDGCSYPWLIADRCKQLPQLEFSVSVMSDALANTSRSYDFVHLSNILDWLSPEEAQRLLTLAWNALRPGGVTLIRQLNSNLEIPAMGPQFQWDTAAAADLLRQDRSFFYRALHLGRKP